MFQRKKKNIICSIMHWRTAWSALSERKEECQHRWKKGPGTQVHTGMLTCPSFFTAALMVEYIGQCEQENIAKQEICPHCLVTPSFISWNHGCLKPSTDMQETLSVCPYLQLCSLLMHQNILLHQNSWVRKLLVQRDYVIIRSTARELQHYLAKTLICETILLYRIDKTKCLH